MSEVIESYKPTPKQAEFHKSAKPQRAFVGGFGAGKSMTGVWEAIDKGMKYPGNRIAVMRDTMPDLRETTMQTFFEQCPAEFIYTYKRKEQLVVLTTGSEILFKSFRATRTAARNQFESKIKGLNLGAFYIDEANEVSKDEYLMLQGRLRLDYMPWRGGWITTNPPNTDHWIYELFEGPTADKSHYQIVKASSRENPHLPADYVANLEREYDPSWVKKFVDGEFGFMVTGDPVYENFREVDKNGNAWHSRLGLKWRSQYGSVHRYWDFGFHRPAVVWAQVSPSLIWKVYKEYMGNNVYIQDFAPKVIDISNKIFGGAKFLDFGDPAGNQKNDKVDTTTIKLLEKDFKIKIQSRFSLISEGVELIQGKINRVIDGEPAFQINPDECPILMAGLTGAYCRAKVSTGKDMQSADPIKDGHFEHTQDALRMGAVNIFGANSDNRNRDMTVGSPSWGTNPNQTSRGGYRR